jgi:hypothetical protein
MIKFIYKKKHLKMLDWGVKLKNNIKGCKEKISKKIKDAIWNDNIEIRGLLWIMDSLVQVHRKEERKSRSQHTIVFPVTHVNLEGRAHCEISNGIRCFINPKSRSQHAIVTSFTCWLVYYECVWQYGSSCFLNSFLCWNEYQSCFFIF